MTRQALGHAKPAVTVPLPGQQVLQRKCACGTHTSGGDKCEACESKQGSLQRKADKPVDTVEVPPIVRDVLRAPGQPLDAQTRDYMEPRFGRDFSQARSRSDAARNPQSSLTIGRSDDGHEREADRIVERIDADRTDSDPGARCDFADVRIHTGDMAAESARAIGARAYTVGRDVVFGAGAYAPRSGEGRRLLAHELTHVLQQQDGAWRIQRFEAPVHEGIERLSLTTDAAGKNAGFSLDESSAVYFGNWMRDMNQLFVPFLVDLVGPEVIFAAVNNVAQKKFGRTVTPEQFGYYIPAEHMDNPAGLVKKYDLLEKMPPIEGSDHSPALPPGLATKQADVDPKKDANLFSVDEVGVMAHVRRSNLHVENRLELAVNSGRTADGLMHFGAALHAVEDLFAHSNWVEIAVSKVLADNKQLLPGLKGEDRQVFTYAPSSGGRPVLTTGSFTGKDTRISLGSELVKVLRAPLAPPKSDAETAADEKFTLEVLRALTTRLKANKAFYAAVRKMLDDLLPDDPLGLTDALIDETLALPLDQIYFLTTLLPKIPKSVKDGSGITAMQEGFLALVSTKFLQPAADRIESEGPESKVSETSLLNNLTDNQRIAAGKWTLAELEAMKEKERLGVASVDVQKAEGKLEGAARTDALMHTPESVLAGPSHSQIAKDHPSSPFFRLAFHLAVVADRMLRDSLMDAWTEIGKGPTVPYKPADQSADPDEVTLREERRVAAEKSKSMARDIVGPDLPSGANETHPAPDPKSYDLAAMRRRSANVLRRQALLLRVFSATAAFARKLDADAKSIQGPADRSPTLEEREAAHAALIATRNMAKGRLDELNRDSSIQTILKTALQAAIAVLDNEINTTAVAYTHNQRDVLEGKQHVAGISQASLSVVASTPPSLSAKPPKLKNLLEQSRTIINHPHKDTWWVDTVKTFVGKNQAEVASQIEARNKGYALFHQPE